MGIVCYSFINIQMNLLANFQNSDSTQESVDNEVQEKMMRCRPFEKWVEAIYQQKTSITELYLISEETQFNLSMGQMYTIIKDRLYNVCKVHKRLIMDSVDVMWADRLSVNKIDTQDLEIQPLDDDECVIQVKQAIIWIIYQHFCSISESNKQICLLWEILNHNLDGSFGFRLNHDNFFELKEDSLNQFALRQLIPTSQHIEFHNFKQNLQLLLQSPSVTQKFHLQELYRIIRKSEIHRCRKITKTMKISMELDPTQTWFSKIKQNKIASKIFSRFNFDYDYWLLNEDISINNNEQVAKLHDSLVPKTLQQHKIDSFNFLEKEDKVIPKPAATQQKNKKKNKKKKKKKTQIQSKPQLKRFKSQQTRGYIQKQKEKVLSTNPSVSEVPKEQHEKTIKMFDEMIIDTNRSHCTISQNSIQKWFKRIKTENL